MLQCKTENRDRCTVVRIGDNRLDAVSSQDFKMYMFDIVDDGIRNIGIDMSNVAFIDSTGLGVLVAVLNRLGQDGTLFLWRVSPEVKSILELTQLYKVLDIYETEDDALGTFG